MPVPPNERSAKGKAEGLVSYSRRAFLVPIPHVSMCEKLCTRLEKRGKRQVRRLQGQKVTITEHFERDRTITAATGGTLKVGEKNTAPTIPLI
jgi:hypothetical protein